MFRLHNIFFNNFNLKILSVILAVLLWFVVIGESKNELGMDVPIEFQGIAQDVTIAGDIPSTIHIRLKGSATLLRPLTKKPPFFSIDLAGAKVGDNVILLGEHQLKNLSLGINVVDITPPTITLTLDTIIEKRLPVVIETSGSLPRGYQIANMSTMPEFAVVRGTKRYLQKIDKITTKPIDLSTIEQQLSREVALSYLPEKIKSIDPLTVKVFIAISEERTQRSIKGVRIDFINKPPSLERLSYSNYFVDLLVNSPQTLLLDEIRHNTNVFVDLAELEGSGVEDHYVTLPVTIELPDKVNLISANPKQVEVIFNQKKK
ncbi:MAG: hypothetical protein JXO49_02890 [Deltaproteobacteria bacterium]|nr:hypothetical protein [Candidatus Anaeroferrophillus wilburensis]MBN2888273.1 hypothetical protein [Deltaproteobacteria bacterium]